MRLGILQVSVGASFFVNRYRYKSSAWVFLLIILQKRNIEMKKATVSAVAFKEGVKWLCTNHITVVTLLQ
jgi:hypothetical protein